MSFEENNERICNAFFKDGYVSAMRKVRETIEEVEFTNIIRSDQTPNDKMDCIKILIKEKLGLKGE